MYRPPAGNLENALNIISDALDTVPTWKSPTIIIGDINVDMLINNQNKVNLENMLASFNVYRIELPPTRITHSTATSIDMVCTNVSNSDINVEVITTGLSDHTAQLCTLTTEIQNAMLPNSTRRHYTQDNLNNLKTLLSNESWHNVYNNTLVDLAYDSFSNILKRALNAACPLKKSRTKKNMDFGIKTDEEVINLKNKYLQAVQNEILKGTTETKTETAARKKEYDLKLKQLRKTATSNYIENAENKQKAIWNVINCERSKNLNKHQTNSIELIINNQLIQDSSLVAQHINEYFTEAAKKTLEDAGQLQQNIQINKQEFNINNNIPDLLLLPTSTLEVTNTIISLKSKPSCGVDEISSVILKHCKEELVPPLTSIINKSFSQGIFPNSLKLAIIFPKLKKNPTTSLDSYRPISLLSTISKVMEKIVLTRLIKHLVDHNIITPQQHGFLKGKSTTSALIKFIEHLLNQMEDGNITSAFFLDFSKAFDCLDHIRLLRKMNDMGVRGVAEKWISSYLKERLQMVEVTYTKNHTIYKTRSTPLPINRGVPQGSVLGPILFILYTNDLPKYLQEYSQVMMYADDTALLVGKKHTAELEVSSFIAINMAQQYSHQNDLVLNASKTQQLNFSRTTSEISGQPEIDLKNNAKYLGVIIDDKLTWTPHIDQLCGKLNTSIYVLNRIKNTTNSLDAAKTAYFSLFESHVRYGLILWGHSSKRNLQRVLILQKKAVRTLAGLNPLDTCRTAFKDLKILTVASLFLSEVICYAITQKLTRMRESHNYNTRNKINFSLPQHHLTVYEKQASYTGPKYYNILPDNLKEIWEERNFKRKLQDWLLQKTFYTLEEFETWKN